MIKSILILIFVVLTMTNCKENKKENNLEIADFVRRNTLIIKGSDTELEMVKDLTKEYAFQNSDITVDISGGGSQLGIEALINNEADIANSSRPMKSKEINRAKKNGVNPIPIMFSVDALAIITNSELGVDSLSTDDLTQIFSGKLTNWKDFGGPDLEITIYGRDSNSGTSSYIKDKFMRGDIDPMITKLKGNAEIVSSVQKNKGAIGYVGVGFLLNENGKPDGRVWAMPIYIKGSLAYSPFEINAVIKGEYVLTRPLYQYINGKPSMKVYDFIMSELNATGQKIIKKHGFFQINNYQAEINKLNGI